MRTSRFLLLALAMAAATAALDWWSVALVAALWTALSRAERPHPVSVALAASVGWALLIGVMAMRGPVMTVASVLGGILPVGTLGILALTLLYPALLAGAAAVLTRALLAATGLVPDASTPAQSS